MGHMADLGRQVWRRIEIDQQAYADVRGILNHYVSNLLGRKPRLQEYLAMLSG
jgi:hypothetical protein